MAVVVEEELTTIKEATGVVSPSSSSSSLMDVKKQAKAVEPAAAPEDEDVYLVLDGAAYDVRKMSGKHPGGDLALDYARGRDLSRTWAALHAFGSPRKLKAWLECMRVTDPALTARIVKRAKPELYVSGDGAMASLKRHEAEEHGKAGGALAFDADLTSSVRAHFRAIAERSKVSLATATKATPTAWLWMLALTIAFSWSLREWAIRRTLLGLLTMPLLGQLVAFSVMHDASHCALSTNRAVNVIGAYWGVAWTSPHEWSLQHVVGHHLQPNVLGEDPDVVHIERYRGLGGAVGAVLLLSVWAVALPIGLTILAPVRLCLRGFYPSSTARNPDRPKWRSVAHFVGRMAHAFLFFGWPFVFMESTLNAFVWVAVPQLLGSVIFMVVTQIAHLFDAAFDDDFYHAASEKKLAVDCSWHSHQLRTASNYATHSKLHTWLTGGLNHQLEHHLFPTVNHCHLPSIAPIVKSVCERHGVAYNTVPSVRAGLARHFDLLRKLSASKPAVVEEGPRVFKGKVWHRRSAIDKEPAHDLQVPDHAMWLIDLDDSAGIQKELGSFPLKFEPRDHFRTDPGHSTAGELATKVRSLVQKRLSLAVGRVELLTMPRYWNYTFNPISVYYAYNEHDLAAVVFEVSNTPWMNETHYVHAARADGRYSDVKDMHVSPFQPMQQTYSWEAPKPNENILLINRVSRGDNTYFEAGYHATLQKEGRKAELFRARPHGTMAGIFWHALVLLTRGAKFYPHPSGVKTLFSRCVEVIYHSRYWLAVGLVSRVLGGLRWLESLALANVLYRALRVLTAPSKPPVATARTTRSSSSSSASSSPASSSAPSKPPIATARTTRQSTAAKAATSSSSASPAASSAPSSTSSASPGNTNGSSSNGSSSTVKNGTSLSKNGTASSTKKQRVAIVGSGIAGNGAAYELSKRGFEVEVFEASERIGGHAWTVDVPGGGTIDVGFQVFNLVNYPLLTALFEELSVPHVESEMSLAVSSSESEWSSKRPFAGALGSIGGFFKRCLLLIEVLRFERAAARLVAEYNSSKDEQLLTKSIESFLKEQGFSTALKEQFVAPLVGALWSVSPSEAMTTFPMLGVAQFMENHFMLGRSRPKWRTPALRSRDYVEKLVNRVGKEAFHVNTKVTSLLYKKGKWGLAGVKGEFDAVVMACSAEQSCSILRASSLDEMEETLGVVGRFKTTSSDVTVHCDTTKMPRDKGAWGAWNALQGGAVSYWANVLQPGFQGEDTFITLNGGDVDNVLWRQTMRHPLLDADAAKGRLLVPSVQGKRGLYFAGAWTGFGFHEDGLKSAHLVADLISGGATNAITAAPSERSTPRKLGVMGRLGLKLVVTAVQRIARSKPKTPEIRITLPDGADVVALEGEEKISMEIVESAALWRVIAEPSMGIAEAYVDGSLKLQPSIRGFLSAAIKLAKNDDASKQPALGPALLVQLSKLKDTALHSMQANTKLGSQKNIAAHYDLSNDFFELFLDETMTYSSALYDDHSAYLEGGESERLQTLEDADDAVLKEAQFRKLDALADKAGIQDGDRILEIGCGWGSLALRCAERFPKCEYVAITISEQQLLEALERVESAPLSVKNRVHIVLCDYRDVVEKYGKFDRVLSCEMIEAVGHEFLPTYFKAIGDALKAGGCAAVQAICVPDDRYPSYIRGSDFIRKHVFPGSSLVCPRAVQDNLPAMLRLDRDMDSLGISYARTLAAWRVRYLDKMDEVNKLERFDDFFLRKWQFYLEYCEAGFATGHIDVLQIKLVKSDEQLAGAGGQKNAAHGGLARTSQDLLIQKAKAVGTAIFDKGYMPDIISRFGIRSLSAQQLRHCEDAGKRAHPFGEGGLAGSQCSLMVTLGELRVSPVAVCTAEANEQHYEVDERFYGYVLGPRRKYSACFYDDSTYSVSARKDAALRLPAAEDAAFAQVVERALIDDTTKSILDIGCGWGSASLYLAARFPKAKIVGVSNSNSQRVYIMNQAKERGLSNLQIVTLDISLLPLTGALEALRSMLPDAKKFERAVSIEMFEHMKNYDALFQKVSAVLAKEATLFVHIFCHRQYCYHFIVKSDADWMAKYFFAGGTMPSADLFLYFAAQPNSPFAMLNHWRNTGNHYALTSEAWLQNMDANEAAVRAVFRDCYPKGEEELWWNRWRAFFLACAELFGYADGQEWCIGHYLFQNRN